MIKRIFIYVFGLFLIILGVVFTTKSNLGIGPINILPFVLSKIFNVSFGTALMFVFIAFVIVQIIILKKVDYKIALQLPFSILFGKLVDIMFAIIKYNPSNIFTQSLFLIFGIILLGVGVYFSVNAHLVMNPPDGAVHELSIFTKKDFGTIKVYIDVSLVVISIIISLIFLRKIVGLNIGTVIISLFTGNVAKVTGKIFNKYI